MANNYLQFSAELTGLTPEHCEWFETYIQEQDAKPRGDGEPCLDFNWEIEGAKKSSIWFHADECGEPAHVAETVQKFFKYFGLDWVWSFTWAVTCSKMRVDEFSGGAVVVTAKRCYFNEAGHWASRKRAEIDRRRKSKRKTKK